LLSVVVALNTAGGSCSDDDGQKLGGETHGGKVVQLSDLRDGIVQLDVELVDGNDRDFVDTTVEFTQLQDLFLVGVNLGDRQIGEKDNDDQEEGSDGGQHHFCSHGALLILRVVGVSCGTLTTALDQRRNNHDCEGDQEGGWGFDRLRQLLVDTESGYTVPLALSVPAEGWASPELDRGSLSVCLLLSFVEGGKIFKSVPNIAFVLDFVVIGHETSFLVARVVLQLSEGIHIAIIMLFLVLPPFLGGGVRDLVGEHAGLVLEPGGLKGQLVRGGLSEGDKHILKEGLDGPLGTVAVSGVVCIPFLEESEVKDRAGLFAGRGVRVEANGRLNVSHVAASFVAGKALAVLLEAVDHHELLSSSLRADPTIVDFLLNLGLDFRVVLAAEVI